MADKLVSFNSCVSIFQPDLKRGFSTISPINIVSGPDTSVLYSWAGSVSYTSSLSIAFGTIDRWRYDSRDPVPLNRDQWTLWSTGTANLVRVKETEKSYIPNHWSSTIPSDIKSDFPQWAINLINDMLEEQRG